MTKDPYQYFRIEAREHIEGLSSGVLQLEKGGCDPELVNRLLRHAHTLKGAARVVRQPRIAELTHSIEEVLAAIGNAKELVSREDVNRLLQLIDAIGEQLKSLSEIAVGGSRSVSEEAETAGLIPEAAGFRPETAGRQSLSPDPSPAAPPMATIRIALSELDPLLHGLAEVGIHLAALREQAGAKLDRALQTLVDKAERELLGLQDRAGQLRLLPVSSLFPSLERAVRDAADSLGKTVEFRATGGGNRLDAHVLHGLSEAMLHLVRNAVSHGIETSAERAAGGKPAAGLVEVAVERRGNRMSFICRDDGRGVDAGRIQRAAVAAGLLSPDAPESLSLEQAVRLAFRAGVSTAEAVTQHAGRGVGLDVVREIVERLQGDVEMQSTPSMGTIVRINVPVSLESMSVLNVEVAGAQTSLPFESVRRVVQISDAEIARTPEGDSILFNDCPAPIISLRALLFPRMPLTPLVAPASSNGKRSIVIVDAGEGPVAIAVDRVLGRETVLLKPLPPMITGADLVLGASLDGSGNPRTILDPSRLAHAARRAPGSAAPPAPGPTQCILVIDDSMTTRMLEQSILEAAGHEVDLAVSGEDGLAKAKQRDYAIFIVDVEMPGMSGFEFIAKVKADPALQRIPAVLVTSRDSDEDRARGRAVGAAAYIVKGNFEEAAFLRTIHHLIG